MKHIKKFNENTEFERVPVKVKDIIEYLQSLDPEMEVDLDKDGWDYYPTGLETVKNSYLFDVFNYKGDTRLSSNNNCILIINN